MDPSMKVSRLSPANQQLVEIARAISNNAKIMIMDEPTAPLAAHEVELLFSIIRKLKERGVTVVYISHRMDEVFQITERISVLRDGRLIKTLDTADNDRRELVSLMVGRELNESFPARTQKAGEVVLEARDLTGNSVEHISFQLHRGEILGFAGLVGSGRSETMELISGAKRPDSGEILINGRKVSIGSPASAIRHGIGLIPEDRKEQGVILHNTVQFNISLSSMKKLTRLGFISGRRNSALAEKYRVALFLQRARRIAVGEQHLARRPGHHHLRRADKGHRRWRKAGDLPAYERPSGERQGHHNGFLGYGGDTGHVRPHNRPA